MIAFDNSSTGLANPATSVTYSHTCAGSESILIVGAYITDNTKTISGATYAGISMIQVAQFTNGVNRVALFYLLSPASGANNVVVTASGSTGIQSKSASYYGVRQVQQPDNSNNQSQASVNTITNNLTPVANNCWTVMYAHSNPGGNITAGTGATRRGASDNDNILDSNAPISPAASYGMVVNFSLTGESEVIEISIAPSLGGDDTAFFM